MFIGLSETVRGASHVESGTVCQDYADYKVTDKYAVAAVADGHGSKKHFRSDFGSKSGVEVAIKAIDEFCSDVDEFERKFRDDPDYLITKIQKYIIKEKKKVVSGTVPEEIFVTKEHKKEEKTGLTVTIPLNEIANIEKAQEKEIESEEEIEILEVEDVIDIDNNSIVTKERNTARERERELLEQISNLLRIKNDSYVQ